MERLLVTGSSGHLGSHLSERLKQAGYEVLKGDRQGNVPEKVTGIFNCGTYGNVYDHKDIPEIYRANVVNVAKLIQSKPDIFINVSSSSVLLPVQTHYSLAKAAGEKIVEHEEGINIRPSTITGVGEAPQRLIPKLIKSCLTGEQMPFVADATHDYIDVEDVVDAMSFIVFGVTSELWCGLRGKTLNVSSGELHTNQEVREIVESVTGKKANIVAVESMRSYDTKSWKVDNSRLAWLGWEPKVTLEQSIKNMVKAYDK